MVMRFVVCGITGTCICWFRSCLITSFLKPVSMISVVILICSCISGMAITRVQAGIREEAAAPDTGRRRPRGPACSRTRAVGGTRNHVRSVLERRDKRGLSGRVASVGQEWPQWIQRGLSESEKGQEWPQCFGGQFKTTAASMSGSPIAKTTFGNPPLLNPPS